MSTIRADDVGPSAGGTTRALVRGTAAAWVNFNGNGTIAARDSENVSSLTDNGTGDYTINFSNAFGAADFSATGSTAEGNTNSTVAVLGIDWASPSASSQRVRTNTSSTGAADSSYVAVTSHGDLA